MRIWVLGVRKPRHALTCTDCMFLNRGGLRAPPQPTIPCSDRAPLLCSLSSTAASCQPYWNGSGLSTPTTMSPTGACCARRVPAPYQAPVLSAHHGPPLHPFLNISFSLRTRHRHALISPTQTRHPPISPSPHVAGCTATRTASGWASRWRAPWSSSARAPPGPRWRSRRPRRREARTSMASPSTTTTAWWCSTAGQESRCSRTSEQMRGAGDGGVGGRDGSGSRGSAGGGAGRRGCVARRRVAR